MAAVTHRVSTPLTTDLSTYTSGSFTPAANDLLVCFVKASGTRIDTGNGIAKLTDSQNLGWTLIDKAIHVASADTLYCFVANKLAANSATTVTFDCTGDAATGSIIEVASVSGMTRTGRDAVRQVAKQENNGSASTPAPTFSNAVLTGNPTLGAVGNGTNPATLTPPTGWTEAADTGYATPASGIEYVTRDSGFTGTTITWGSTSASANGCIAIELDTSTATSSPAYFISAGTAATAASGNVTPALPTSPAWAADDILLLVISAADNVVCTLPAGWTIKQATNSGTALRQTIAWRRAVAGDTAPLVTHTGGNNIRAQVLAIRSAYKSGDPITAINTTASTTTTTVTGPTITPTTNNSAIFFIGSEGFSNTSGAPTYTVWTGTDPTFIEVSDGTAVAGTLMASLGVAWGQQKTAAAISSRTATIVGEAGAPTATIGTQLSIAPASPVITQASFRFYEDGTETGSTATAAQDTNISRDVTSDSNLALRVRLQESAAYAGLSTDDYYLQYSLNSGTYVNINDGSTIVDSYDVSNQDTNTAVTSNADAGQSVTGTGLPLYQVSFLLQNTTGSTGNLTAVVYAHSGTFGTSSVGTGAALATSDNVSAASVTSTLSLVTFTFTGANQITLANGTNYVVTMHNGSTFVINLGYDASSPTHAGNHVTLNGGTWAAFSTRDAPFYLYCITNPLAVTGYNSASLTDAGATTNRLGAGTGSFVAGKISEDGLVDDHQLTASNYTEHLYSLTVVSTAVSNTNTLDFRVLRNGSVLDTYTATPRITVTKSAGVTAIPGVASLTTSLFAPTVTASDNQSVTPGLASLTTTTFAPSIVLATVVIPATASLMLASFAATVAVSNNQSVTPGLASLTLTTFASSVTVSNNQSVTPGLATLTITLFAPTVTASNNQSVTPSLATLVLSSFAPAVTVSDNKTVIPGIASLTTTLFTPTVTSTNNQTVIPSLATLATTMFAPVVTAGDNKTVIPGTQSLTLTTFAPTTRLDIIAIPGTSSLTLTTFAPSVTATANVTVTPNTQALTITSFASSIASSGNQSVIPSTASLTLTAFVPSVTASANISVIPNTITLSLTAFAPTIAATDNKTVIPGTTTLTLTTFAPTATSSNNQLVTPGVYAMVMAMFAPTVTGGSSVTATPNTYPLSLSSFAPTVLNGTEQPTSAVPTPRPTDVVYIIHKKSWLQRSLHNNQGIWSANPLPERLTNKIYPETRRK